jgi:hypothetical protein
MNFLTPKPRLSPLVYGLIALAAVGLLALGIAAYTAFIQVAGWVQALAASVLIEAVMVLEAMAIIRRNRWAIAGVVVSLIVSVTYNYIQAQHAGAAHGLTNWWQLGTLAVGPLSALLFLALTIGHELAQHDQRVDQWSAGRQAWQQQQAAQAAQLLREQEERSQQLLLERERITAQIEIEKARAMATEDRKIEVARLRNDARHVATNVADAPTMSQFSRGYDGFVEYLSWLKSQARTFDKTQAASDLGRSKRQIERYIEEGRQNGAAELLRELQ